MCQLKKEVSGVDITDRLRAVNMNASLSGSSNSNDESDSGAVEDIEDDDLEMSSPSGTPLFAFPCAIQSFPQAAYMQLTEGLNRLPSWTVFPASLADCLAATVEITRQFGRHVMLPPCCSDHEHRPLPLYPCHHSFSAAESCA